ncbi:AAA family ATPase [Roseomonas mucosa]|uniref:AAA family ATPase n=1 Tax=Roseomonas mucosa TaxID=207340 RepID=UPI002245C05C|nr:AAA family ATPase [Roseomonas mucosa]
MRQLHVITGGPGSGKSSLIEALAARGYAHMPEAGRAIIQDQTEIGGDALPWADRERFAELMLGWELRSYRDAATSQGPVIFDRGIPDVIGYLRLCQLPVPTPTMRAAELRRYARRVFIAPYWPEIFTNDAERKQSSEEASATFNAMKTTYTMLDYELVELPKISIEERADFVCSLID